MPTHRFAWTRLHRREEPRTRASLAWIAAMTMTCACSGPAVTPIEPVEATPAAAPVAAAFAYPMAHAGTTTDDYHGTIVADPYRWLESDGPETKAWIQAQNALTFKHLEAIPERAAIRRRLESVWNYPRHTVPVQEGGRYFFRRNDGLQNQAVLYSTTNLKATPTVLLDPNKLTADGTVALQVWQPSRDGKRVAYGLATAGSDWVEIRVRDVASGKDLDDHLRWVKFSGLAWDVTGTGFYYSRYDAPVTGQEFSGVNEFHKLCFHRLGTAQAADVVVYERKDQKTWGFAGDLTEDGRYLLITTWRGAESKNALAVLDLQTKAKAGSVLAIVHLVTGFEGEYVPIGNDGPLLWVRTDLDAPRGRIVAMDLRKPAAGWKEVIAQGPATLDAAHVVGDRFVVHTMRDARSEVRLHHLDGKLDKLLDLPAPGSAEGFGGKRSERETFYAFSSFLFPGAIYRYDFATGKTDVFARPDLGFDPARFETKQVFVTSADGTQVPMFVTHQQGLKLDGSNPTYLFGYGGFNVTMTPFFSPAILTWMQMGGVFAMPVLRGGGEYGQAWHEAGMKANKQRVFDDFIASAQWLVKQGYTSPKHLGIGGGSNGGLLVGACLTQRPELFGAALPAVGVMDMLRFHNFTIGWAWVPEYGSSDDAKDFAVLFKYSPLHNIRAGVRHPATLVTTADHDDRVVPGHSFKFAATLQKAQAQGGADGVPPVLIRIETKAGHGAGKPTAKLIDEAADRWAFLVRHLGLKLPADFK